MLSVRRHCGMLAGLSCALQLIEDVVVRTSPQHRVLYQGRCMGMMGTAELPRLVPFPCELLPLHCSCRQEPGRQAVLPVP